MKLIFLDFDGVLNSRQDHGRDFLLDIYPEYMPFLNYIIKKTGAKVVVSSAWRIGETVETLQTMLDAIGFKGEVIGRTFCLGGGRGYEIHEYLNDFDLPVDFVIIDDEVSDMHHLLPYVVKTSYDYGLTLALAEKAIKTLNSIPAVPLTQAK